MRVTYSPKASPLALILLLAYVSANGSRPHRSMEEPSRCHTTHSYTDAYGCDCECGCCLNSPYYHKAGYQRGYQRSGFDCGCDCDCSSDHDSPVPGDLNIRFNKVFEQDSNVQFRLYPNDYPIRGQTARFLKTKSIGVSVITDDDPELHGEVSAESYISRIGAPYSFPNADPRHPYWDEFRYVVDVQLARRAGVNPNKIFRLPDLWQGMDIHEVAKAVHNEYPGSLQQQLLEWIFQQEIKLDYDIVPFRSKVDIIAYQFRFADLNTWVYGAVSPTTFLVKWHVGMPRPEEVAWKIATGELTTAHGVPEDIVYKIRSMNLRKSYDFTAYEEGCPGHPSWPAMHSSGSCVSLWLPLLCKDLTPEQYCEALRVDYAVAFARTVAGVHYSSDNIAGLNLGKEIMKEKLADHFAKYYGSDRARVQAKLEQLSFDWADFDPEDCSIGQKKILG